MRQKGQGEREGESIVEKQVEMKSHGTNEKHFVLGGKRASFNYKVPRLCPPVLVKVKTLGWLELVP
jgi:hypothetical protein